MNRLEEQGSPSPKDAIRSEVRRHFRSEYFGSPGLLAAEDYLRELSLTTKFRPGPRGEIDVAVGAELGALRQTIVVRRQTMPGYDQSEYTFRGLYHQLKEEYSRHALVAGGYQSDADVEYKSIVRDIMAEARSRTAPEVPSDE